VLNQGFKIVLVTKHLKISRSYLVVSGIRVTRVYIHGPSTEEQVHAADRYRQFFACTPVFDLWSEFSLTISLVFSMIDIFWTAFSSLIPAQRRIRRCRVLFSLFSSVIIPFLKFRGVNRIIQKLFQSDVNIMVSTNYENTSCLLRQLEDLKVSCSLVRICFDLRPFRCVLIIILYERNMYWNIYVVFV
jgi:hypothetical protein